MMLPRMQPPAVATQWVLRPQGPIAVSVRHRHPYASGQCSRDVAPGDAQQSHGYACTTIAAAAAACTAAVVHRNRCRCLGRVDHRLRQAAAASAEVAKTKEDQERPRKTKKDQERPRNTQKDEERQPTLSSSREFPASGPESDMSGKCRSLSVLRSS